MNRFDLLKMITRNDPSHVIPGFDPDFYRRRYSDVDTSGLSAAEHYLKIGRGEHRDPNAYFSAKGYLTANPDVAAAGFDPLSHFLIHGIAQNYGGWQRRPDDNPHPSSAAAQVLPQGRGISHWLEEFTQVIRAQIRVMERELVADPDSQSVKSTLDYWWFHERRWIMTFRCMAPFIDPSANLIEVGGASSISNFLGQKGMQVAGTSHDLRNPMPEVGDASHDTVLCLEVIEHIKDQDGSNPVDIFNETGVRCLVSEIHRILKPGGIAICTTPNGCSYSAIARSVKMEPPMFFRKHVREFTPDELRETFEQVGFETVYLETPPEPWGQRDDLDIGAVERMVIRAGGDTRLREDDMVAIFRKPSA